MSTEPQHPLPSGEILPVGTRIEGHVIEQWLAAVPDGHVYRVIRGDTGAPALLHEYLPATWARRIVDKVSARPGRGHEFRGGLHRFLQRAHQLAEIPHAGLPELLRVWTSHGTAYCLMPDVRGRLLLDVVNSQGGSLPASQVLPWVNACCEMAQWLHAQGKIHAAWDPSAIWVLEDSKLLLPAPDAGGGALPASPWVALEQTVLAPSGCEPGPWTDVFGIAALAGFLLTGKGPRGAPGGLRSAAGVTLTGGQRAAQGEALPAALMTAIRVSLRPNPRERPQDIGQFRGLAGLTQLSAQLGVAAPVPPALPTSVAPALTMPPQTEFARPAAPGVPAAALDPVEPAMLRRMAESEDSGAFATTQPPIDAVLPAQPSQPRAEPAQRRRATEPVRRKRGTERFTALAQSNSVPVPPGVANAANAPSPVALGLPLPMPVALPAAVSAVLPATSPMEAEPADVVPGPELPLATRPEASVGHRELAPLPGMDTLPAVAVQPATALPHRRPGSTASFRRELAFAVMGVLAFAAVWFLVAPPDPDESTARKSSSGTLAQQQADLERQLRAEPPAAGTPEMVARPLPAPPAAQRPSGSDGTAAALAGLTSLVPAAVPSVAVAASAAPAAREPAPRAPAPPPRLSACTQALLEASMGATPVRTGSDCR